jgi:hypothetical protein
MLYLHTERPLRPAVVVTLGFAWPLVMLPIWLYYHPAVLQETLGRYGVVDAELVSNFRGKPLADILAELRAPLRFSGITGRVSLYWYFYDPAFLFLSGGYTNVVNSTRHVGVFLLPFLLLIPLGLWRLVCEWRQPIHALILFGFFTAPVAACLVVPEPYAIDREMPVVPFGVLIATSGLVWLAQGTRRWQRPVAVCALAFALAHFVYFLSGYFGEYRERSAFWFNRNHRGALEAILSHDQQSPAPAIYLTSGKDPYMASYWQLTLIKTGRRDLLARTVYFDDDRLDLATVPAGSLILSGLDDRRLIALTAAGELRRLADISEPADPAYFSILQR